MCQKYTILDAMAYLFERTGNLDKALQQYFLLIEGTLRAYLNEVLGIPVAVRGGKLPENGLICQTIDKYLNDITEMFLRNKDSDLVEQEWYNKLDKIIL